MPTVAELMASINAHAEALDTSSKAQYHAIIEAAKAEAEFRRAFDTEIVKIKIDADKGERMPAEDVRKALAHDRVDEQLYLDFVQTAAKAEAMKARARGIESAMTGRQSVLRTLSEEARHG